MEVLGKTEGFGKLFTPNVAPAACSTMDKIDKCHLNAPNAELILKSAWWGGAGLALTLVTVVCVACTIALIAATPNSLGLSALAVPIFLGIACASGMAARVCFSVGAMCIKELAGDEHDLHQETNPRLDQQRIKNRGKVSQFETIRHKHGYLGKKQFTRLSYFPNIRPHHEILIVFLALPLPLGMWSLLTAASSRNYTVRFLEIKKRGCQFKVAQ